MNFTALKNFLDFYLPMLGVPGSDTVIYKDHEEIFRYQSGYDNLKMHTPVRSDALYHMYSVTKVSTCLSVMQLIERGEILVTDPVYAYFPEYAHLRVKVKQSDGSFEVVDAKKPMLIKHLLTMTSGLDYELDRPSINRVRERTGGKCPTLDVIRALPEDPLVFEPGTHYRYSLSHDVLGGIVELVSGMKLGDYMKENIFDPLGMKNTSFGMDDDKRARLATQYDYDAVNKCAVEAPIDRNRYRFGTEYQSGGAGLVSCVDDQILLADALAHLGVGKNGNRIISSYAVNLMRKNAMSDELLKEFSNNHHIGYGYGYGVRTNLDGSMGGNIAPEGIFGWDGAKLSYLSADPTNKIAVFHAEHMGGLHRVVLPRLCNVIYSCLDED